MEYRAVIKKSGDWWIGWLVDLPGVNAQEKNKEELIQSLRMGAEDLLSTSVPFEAEALMTTIDVPTPTWGTVARTT
jgi:predicted RNase H-like HicB family nuclease